MNSGQIGIVMLWDALWLGLWLPAVYALCYSVYGHRWSAKIRCTLGMFCLAGMLASLILHRLPLPETPVFAVTSWDQATQWLVLAWAVCSGGILTRFAIRSFALFRHMRSLPKSRWDTGELPVIKVSQQAQSPFLAGWLRPTIVLTEALEAGDRSTVNPVIFHEMAHFQRRDHWALLAQRGLQSLFFFHPGVRWLSRQVSIERELACDDYVLRDGHIGCRQYAAALLALEAPVGPTNVLAFGEDEATGSRALRVLVGEKRTKASLASWLLGCLSIVIIAVVGLSG
ncbi:MAG: M56 family metallopeptidase, partial [Verrucomicrobiota bacterium]